MAEAAATRILHISGDLDCALDALLAFIEEPSYNRSPNQPTKAVIFYVSDPDHPSWISGTRTKPWPFESLHVPN